MRVLREWLQRLLGTVSGARSDDDLEEELRLHAELAAEDARRHGRAPSGLAPGARAEGRSVDRALDALRDQRGLPWLDALKSDVIFGWRQIRRHRAVSVAVVLSLGLAIGGTGAAFRLVDAVLLRPLPVADPDRLFYLYASYVDSHGEPETRPDFDYPTFQRYRQLLAGVADVMLVGQSSPQDATIGAEGDAESVLRQYVSGNVFGILGLQPAVGRLLSPADDDAPGAHPVAVLSYDYWTRRFKQDPKAVGTIVRMGDQRYEIVGVAPAAFIGTEPGLVPDLFIPSTMNTEALNSPGWSWFLIWVRPARGIGPEPLRQMLQADSDRDHQARLKGFSSDTPRKTLDAFLSERITLRPAGHGASPIQEHLGTPLLLLTALVGVVLLMACATAGNLLTGLTMARAREMALRVSIGAGRGRLIQLVLVESAMLALAASAIGTVVAWWAAPAVMSMIEPIEIPVRLVFDLDWRLVAFGVGLTLLVTGLFGIVPALRASSVTPVIALKGGEVPRSRRVIKSLVVVQMTFCAFVLFVALLFMTTFERLAAQSFGFSYDRVLVLAADSRGEERMTHWRQIADVVRRLPGVESAALAGWPLLSGNGWNQTVHGGDQVAEVRPEHFLGVSAEFFKTLRVDMLEGRDFRVADTGPHLDAANQPVAGVGIVNSAFARRYFGGRSPVGRRVTVRQAKDVDAPMDIVGLVRDTAYRDVRESMQPIVFVPFGPVGEGTLMVRAAGDPMALSTTLGRVFRHEWPDARVRRLRLARDFIDTQMIVERLLSRLTACFALLGLLLAGVGLYGVINDAVIQRRREIGVRMALGAQAADIVRHVTVGAFMLVSVGLVLGLGSGVAFGRVVSAVLFHVTPTDAGALATPLLVLAVVFVLASLPPVLRAVRTDPTETLRSD